MSIASAPSEQFKRCSTCRSPIAYGARYYRCSVSTCNRRATALFFCSVPCWDAHVPDAKHRDAWAEVETAPDGPELAATEERPVRRKVVAPSTDAEGTGAQTPGGDATRRADLPRDVLVVMSKVKSYIKAHSDLRTSDSVSDPLSEHLRDVCDAAIKSARANERGTVLARDIAAALSGTTASE